MVGSANRRTHRAAAKGGNLQVSGFGGQCAAVVEGHVIDCAVSEEVEDPTVESAVAIQEQHDAERFR